MQNILHALGSAFVTGLLAIGSLFSPSLPPSVGATIPVSTAVFQTSLSSGITASATSMTLVTGTNSAGDSLSGYTCFNIDEGTSLEEFVCGTASGTAITSMLRGIDPKDGDLEVTALKKAHRRGASVKITDYPSIAIVSRILNGDETLPNKISYNAHPTFSADTEIVDKKYVDDTAFAGAPDATTTAKGVSEEATAAEINAGTGAGGTSARLFINPSTLATSNYFNFLPLTAQKDALAGNGGTPSTSNKYLTQSGFQAGSELFIADASASSTAYTATLSPAISAYTDGMVVRVKIGLANTTTTPTLAVNGLTARTIVKLAGTALVAGDIAAGMYCEFQYDLTNTRWILLTPVATITTPTYTIPQQILPYITSNVTQYATEVKMQSSTDGSVLFFGYLNAAGTQFFLNRLLKDTITGQYTLTHQATLAPSTAADSPALMVTTSYLYVAYSNGGVDSITRYDVATLANPTAITISGGSGWSAGDTAFSNGTDLYIFDTAAGFVKYTISGTTATYSSTVTYTGAGSVQSGSSTSDGTSVYTTENSTGTTVINKYALAGGAVSSSITRYVYPDANPSASTVLLFIARSDALGIGYAYTNQSATAVIGSELNLSAITKF